MQKVWGSTPYLHHTKNTETRSLLAAGFCVFGMVGEDRRYSHVVVCSSALTPCGAALRYAGAGAFWAPASPARVRLLPLTNSTPGG